MNSIFASYHFLFNSTSPQTVEEVQSITRAHLKNILYDETLTVEKIKHLHGILFAQTTNTKDKDLKMVLRLYQFVESSEKGSINKIRTEKGGSGALLITTRQQEQDKTLLVFKQNPLGDQFGISKDKTITRERLAYTLDYKAFGNVLPTVIMQMDDLSIASLQYYKKNYSDLEENKLTPFDQLPQKAIRKIALFQILMVARDTNLQNILIGKGKAISIDHSYILPDRLTDTPSHNEDIRTFLTTNPFSEDEIEYIEKFPIEEFEKVLRKNGLSENAIRIQKTAHLLCKEAIKKGTITLFDLHVIFYVAPIEKEIFFARCTGDTRFHYVCSATEEKETQKRISEVLQEIEDIKKFAKKDFNSIYNKFQEKLYDQTFNLILDIFKK